MNHEITVFNKSKGFFIGFIISLSLFSGVIIFYRELDLRLQWILFTSLIVLPFFLKKVIRVKNIGKSTEIFIGSGIWGLTIGDSEELNNIAYIYLYVKAGLSYQSGGDDYSFKPIAGGNSAPIGILQLINDKEQIIFSLELFDEEEMYKVAYWLQKIIKVDIQDYIGDELVVIPFE